MSYIKGKYTMKKKDKDDIDVEELMNDDKDDMDILSDDDKPYYDSGDYSEMPMERHSDLLKQLTDFEPHIQQMFYGWLAVEYDEDKKVCIKIENVNPMMNEQGCRAALSILRTYLRGNNIITHLDQHNYNSIMEDCAEYIGITMGTNDDKYGITSDSTYYMIFNQLYHSIQLLLLGAGGTSTYKDLLTATVTHHEDVRSSPEDQRMEKLMSKPSFTRRMFGKMFG